MNRVQKGFPWYPATLLNDSHIDSLSKWGFNAVRLGTMWSGVEIKPFVVNNTYLDIMDGIVKSLADRGMYVILDMHQDGLSTKFNNYDGVPRWLIDSFPPPSHEFPWPFDKPPFWMLNYVTAACGDAFNDIYTNKSQALDHLSFFWQTVAKRFGKYDNVLGYEIINEPFPGNVIADPLLFLPGHTGSTILQPFYDTIFNAINQVDDTTLVFYEPVTWGMIFHGSIMGSGFSHVPGGDKFKDRNVLSFHYYCWVTGVDNKEIFPFWMRELCDKLFYPDVLDSIQKDIEDTGGGSFLTEFGNCEAGPDNSTEYQECLSVLTESDNAFVSWTYWDSQFFGAGGVPVEANVKLFSRTYPQAIAGVPLSSTFDKDTGDFMFVYESNPKISEPTIIYASTIHYPSGFDVNCSTNFTVSGNYVSIVSPPSKSQFIKVSISRKA